jgi:hypothetical protein
MSDLVKGIFGGAAALFGGGPKTPKPDPTIEALQKQQLQNEQSREADLSAQEAASRRALESGRVGRSLLTYTPAASKGSDKLGA